MLKSCDKWWLIIDVSIGNHLGLSSTRVDHNQWVLIIINECWSSSLTIADNWWRLMTIDDDWCQLLTIGDNWWPKIIDLIIFRFWSSIRIVCTYRLRFISDLFFWLILTIYWPNSDFFWPNSDLIRKKVF